MKANELMIGDFLRYKQDFPYAHLQGKIVKVCGVDGRVDVRTINDGKFHESEHPNWLEPIPLTPEILEKNGFEKKTFYGIYDDYFDLDIREYSDGLYIVTYHSCEFNIPDQTIHLSWVHELQHFMRHCGIEHDIKL